MTSLVGNIKSVKIGPGALVAAAFIGPGTVTACTIAGAQFGYSLIWVLVFATFAAILLQEMAARLGIVTGKGLGEVFSQATTSKPVKWATIALILSALFVGNAAYEAGNLSGAALGISAAFGEAVSVNQIIPFIALLAGGILLFGGYKIIEKILISLVVLMSLAFLATAIIVQPDLGAMAAGFVPSIPVGGLMTVLALIGTTIVPYNLFLHAAAARDRFSGDNALHDARVDTGLSIGFGGLISILILTTAAASMFAAGLTVTSAADMSRQLEPAFGAGANYMMAVGLFAAGLSSAITAPMATGYALTECFGLDSKGKGFKATALVILAIGASVGTLDIKPIDAILFAQMANGLLLPIIAVFLLVTMNRTKILGKFTNSAGQNVLGAAVILIAVGLGVRLIMKVVG